MKKETVSIVGCGWLGKALAKRLEKTHWVKASVQSEESFNVLEIEKKYILNHENRFTKEAFYEADSLIISLPPRGAYLDNLASIVKNVKLGTQLILLSSTSVYVQTSGVVREESTKKLLNPNLMLQGERLVQKLFPSVLILRLGGLMGYNRVAGKYTAGKVLEEDAPVNYLHRDDAVNIMLLVMEKKIKAEVLNVTAQVDASKREIYEYNSKKYGFEKTAFKSLNIVGKKVSSLKLLALLNYTFKYDSCETICGGEGF